MRNDTETTCHCGTDYNGSDHCPECGCEQYESYACEAAREPIVTLGRGWHGLDAYKVEAPEGHRFIPGRTVLVCPAHEEAPGWRAILAGYLPNGDAIVVPLQGHFGEMRLRKIQTNARGRAGLCLAKDEPLLAPLPGEWQGRSWDERDWTAAKVLALSAAMSLDLRSAA